MPIHRSQKWVSPLFCLIISTRNLSKYCYSIMNLTLSLSLSMYIYMCAHVPVHMRVHVSTRIPSKSSTFNCEINQLLQ